jgi:biotin transport system substrate-specific component
MSTIALTLAPPRSRAVARVSFQIACAVIGSFLVAGLAQISIHLGFTPVPITGQTLGVLLIGGAYGPELGAATLVLYLVWGAIGLPVFAPQADGSHLTGLHVLTFASVTGGYLWGFVLASGVVGWLSRRGWDRSINSSIGAMLLGSVALYGLGLPWLHHALPSLTGGPVTWRFTLEQGLYPFVIGDTVKLMLAAGFMPTAWKLVRRLHPGGEG